MSQTKVVKQKAAFTTFFGGKNNSVTTNLKPVIPEIARALSANGLSPLPLKPPTIKKDVNAPKIKFEPRKFDLSVKKQPPIDMAGNVSADFKDFVNSMKVEVTRRQILQDKQTPKAFPYFTTGQTSQNVKTKTFVDKMRTAIFRKKLPSYFEK